MKNGPFSTLPLSLIAFAEQLGTKQVKKGGMEEYKKQQTGRPTMTRQVSEISAFTICSCSVPVDLSCFPSKNNGYIPNFGLANNTNAHTFSNGQPAALTYYLFVRCWEIRLNDLCNHFFFSFQQLESSILFPRKKRVKRFIP